MARIKNMLSAIKDVLWGATLLLAYGAILFVWWSYCLIGLKWDTSYPWDRVREGYE